MARKKVAHTPSVVPPHLDLESADTISQNLRQVEALLDLIQRADGRDLCSGTLMNAAALAKRLVSEASDAGDLLWKQCRAFAGVQP